MNMVIPLIKISNDPQTGNVRQVRLYNINYGDENSVIIYSFEVRYYDPSGNEIRSGSIDRYRKEIIIDDTIAVNSSDGSICIDSNNKPNWNTSGVMNKYDYIVNYINNNNPDIPLIQNIIVKTADNQRQFN
jgi:hypothetical protein